MARGKKNGGATLGYEAQLWQMAGALRGSMGAAEYKHVVLGRVFLTYASDACDEKHAALVADQAQGAGVKADLILANPPVNISDWGGERPRDDRRWQHGVPPAGTANIAWGQW